MRGSLASLPLAGFAFIAALAPLTGWAQPASPPTSVEIEEDVEVVATPETSPQPAAAEPPSAAAEAPAAPVEPPSPATAEAPPPTAAAPEPAPAAPPPPPPAAAAAPPEPKPTAAPEAVEDPWLGIRWSAWVQAQYESSQRSEDQLQQGGQPLNRDRFLVRRARLRAQRSWQFASLDVELDLNTVNDLAVAPRRAAGAVFWPAPEPDAVPYLRAQLGLLDIPFGHELPAGARSRLFAERSTASQAFFPSEADIGVALDGGYGPLRYAVALMNGVEAGSAYRVRDPNAAKDILARIGVELTPVEIVRVIAGVSFIEGTGFHPGSDATKNSLEWNDINEDGSKTDAEVFAEPGQAATPSENFDRWGVGVDARVGLQSAIGWSWLYGEITFAQNLDRGLFAADPIATSLDARELGYHVALVQEITPYAVAGFRLDFYDGNADSSERRHGKAFEQAQSVYTYSPVIGAVLPGYARLSFQYDIIVDKFARDSSGEPTDLKNNQWTLRLQVGL